MDMGYFFAVLDDERKEIFAKGALKMKSFAIFVEILRRHENKRCTLSELAKELRSEVNVEWTDATAHLYVKIMLDWSRNAGLAPDVFTKRIKQNR